MLEKDLDYLQKYHSDVEIISTNAINICEIPTLWKHILMQPTAEKRVYETLNMWAGCVAEELRNTIIYMRENLEDVALIKYSGSYSLLYCIRASDGQVQYYEGGNPVDLVFPHQLQTEWDKFPASIVKFFSSLHNGFFCYTSGGMGLLPVPDIVIFDEEDWGILDELSQPLQIQLKTTFGLFVSGMGGYVAIDSSNCENCKSTLWFTRKQPKYGINFWNLVDEWIVIGMQG